jgi:hypothetical protein
MKAEKKKKKKERCRIGWAGILTASSIRIFCSGGSLLKSSFEGIAYCTCREEAIVKSQALRKRRTPVRKYTAGQRGKLLRAVGGSDAMA